MLISPAEHGTNSNAGLKVSHPINIPYPHPLWPHIHISLYSFLSGFLHVLNARGKHTHMHVGLVSSLNILLLCCCKTCLDQRAAGGLIYLEELRIKLVPSLNIQIVLLYYSHDKCLESVCPPSPLHYYCYLSNAAFI